MPTITIDFSREYTPTVSKSNMDCNFNKSPRAGVIMIKRDELILGTNEHFSCN